MTCRACGGECPSHVTFCASCLLDLWIEAEREVRHEMIELFASQLNEPTAKIWERING
jgi:hypothetical protein